MIDPGHE